MLLYESFLGHRFAGHLDSVRELVGDNLESTIDSPRVVILHKGLWGQALSRFPGITLLNILNDFLPTFFLSSPLTTRFPTE